MSREGIGPLVVVGDTLLDVDVTGRAERLAPDAPVPVLKVEGETERPGGAGLAAVLARRMAGPPDGVAEREVVLVTPMADDAAGERLGALLAAAGVRVIPLPHRGRTTVKRRLLAQDGRPLLRMDEGEPGTPGALPAAAVEAIRSADAVLVSDYGLGTTFAADVRAALSDLPGRLVWDPHPRGADPVPGADLVTPNDAEARGAQARRTAHRPGRGEQGGSADGRRDLADLADRAARLLEVWRARAVAVTLGARGVLLSRGDEPPIVVPAPVVGATGRDTCGAGDCFAATAALALARGALTSEAVEQAVASATRFVAAGGAASYPAALAGPVVAGTPEVVGDARAVAGRVREAGGTVVATGGCFDLLHAGHVATLRAARSLGDCLVVLVNSDASVRRLKGPARPIVPEADRARVLAALDAVDAVVVFDDDTPEGALRELRPDVWVKGGDYSVAQLPEAAVLREWGGQTVVLPYLEGRSTTRMVAHAAGRES